MNVAVICEFSGTVRDAFTRMGHDATSFDLLPSETPGKHVMGDVMQFGSDYWKQFDLAKGESKNDNNMDFFLAA